MRRALMVGAAGRFVVAALFCATDPRNSGKAHFYALNKIPGAKSACGMRAGKISQNQKMFQLMEHSAIHELHHYQLSQ
jgi:hypothetical protein